MLVYGNAMTVTSETMTDVINIEILRVDGHALEVAIQPLILVL